MNINNLFYYSSSFHQQGLNVGISAQKQTHNLVLSYVSRIEKLIEDANPFCEKNDIVIDSESLWEIKRLLVESDFSIGIFTEMNKNHLFTLINCYDKKIEKYGIDQNQLFEMAKLCGKISWCLAKKLIVSFGPTEQLKLFEIAKLCAQTNEAITVSEIGNFGILDQLELFEIAKLCAKNGGLLIPGHIKNFGITTLELSEIAMLCAHNYGSITANHIENFNITNPVKLFEIAMQCAQTDMFTAEYINNFGIKDPLKLFKIAKVCGRNIPDLTLQSIKSFGLTDQIILIEIVKLCAQSFGGETAKYIANFGIIDQNELVEIAKICAHNNGAQTASNIVNFGITDPIYLFEIAKICPKRGGGEEANIIIMNSINIFNLNIKESFFILKKCIENISPNKYILCLSLFFKKSYPFEKKLEDNESMLTIRKGLVMLKDLFKEELPNEISNFDFDKAIEILFKYSNEKFKGNPFENVLKNVINISDAYSKYQSLHWLADTMVIFNTIRLIEGVSDDQIFSLKDQGIFESIASFGKPTLRLSLSIIFLSILSIENGLEIFNQLHLPQQTFNKKHENFLNILCLFFAALVAQGLDVNSKIFTGAGNFRQEIEKKSSCFYKKENFQIMIEMLLLLVQDTTLSAKEKEDLLVRIISEKPKDLEKSFMTTDEVQAAYLHNVQSLVSIFEFNEASRLSDFSRSLVEISEETLKEKLSCGNVENFTLKYHQNFRESRNPSAIVSYAAKINSLNDKDAAECLGDYVASTLEGPSAFREKRYDLTNNLHLQQINEFNPKLFEEWKKNLAKINFDEIKFDENFTANILPSAKDWVIEKLITDKHLDMENLNLNHLNRYLQNSDSRKLNEIEQELLSVQKAILLAPKIILRLKKCNDKIKKIDSILLSKSAKINLAHLNERKKNFQLKFEKDLSELKNFFPVLNQRITLGNNFNEIINIIDGCDEILHTTSLNVKEIVTKLRFEFLCIQWIKGFETLHFSNVKMDNNQIQSCEDKMKKSLVEILEILNAFPFNSPEFANDVLGKINEKTVSMAVGNTVVIETDDPIDILLCGTEVDGSCQRVDGNANLNKGLLGYAMDGKIKILAIKNAEGPYGKIYARCILRVLWDGEKPVLFLERFYPSNFTSKQTYALTCMARKKAEILGVSLLSLDGKGKEYGKPLIALGGSSPWEYCDGFRGMTKGSYKIDGAQIV